ncbi:MAG: hypothetical protein JEZ09_06245 [Salinivirgaceae bacterium]|nr:hypothetical protein [Salinivirgaceae bacterium]
MMRNTFILKVLNIKKGEGRHVFLLFTLSFFTGISYAFLYTTATSLFLSNFNVRMLPYAYMGGGLLSYILWVFYHSLERKIKYSNLLLLASLFLFISLSFLVVGCYFFEIKLFVFLLFVWINAFIFFSATGFWGIASKIFNLLQGKRLFGLISSGEILSKTLTFFMIPFILRYIETKDLLFLIVIGYFFSLCFLIVIVSKYSKLLSVSIGSRGSIKKPLALQATGEKKSIAAIMQNKYYAYLIILAIFPLFAAYFVDYIFLNQTKIQFATQDIISSFLSVFFGIMAVVEFVLKSFISGRFISKYGMLFGLLILPITLTAFTILTAVYGTFYGATALFFSFIVINKLFARVFRTSFLDPSYQILFQLIPVSERLVFQGRVEGVSKSIGNIIVGATLILFASISSLTVVHYNYIFICVLVLWMCLSYNLYLEYRKTLIDTLKSHEKEKDYFEEKESNIFLFCKMMEEKIKPNFNLLLNLLDQIEPHKTNSFLRKNLVSANNKFQGQILAKIKDKSVLSARRLICKYLHSGIKLENKDLFEDTLSVLDNSQKMDIDKLAELTYSSNPDDRILAANLLLYSVRYGSVKLLCELLQDDNTKVRKAAIITSGVVGKVELWPHLINNLFYKTYSSAAMCAIRVIGDPILPELTKCFNKLSTPNHIKLKIIAICSGIYGERALRFLKSNIQYPDEAIRQKIFVALSKRGYYEKNTLTSLIKGVIEEEIAITVWIIAAILDIKKDNSTKNLVEELNFEFAQKKENVFLLLSILYDSSTILYIRKIFKSGTKESKVFATEILDLSVSSDIKELFLPLITNSSLTDTLRLYGERFPQQKMTVYNRLVDIINKDYLKVNVWIKVCSLVLLKNFPDNDSVLLAHVFNPNPILNQISKAYLKQKKSKRLKEINTNLSTLSGNSIYDDNEDGILLYDKVLLLKKNALFNSIHKCELTKMVQSSKEIRLSIGDCMFPNKLVLESIYLIVEGELNIYSNEEKIGVLESNEVFWKIAFDLEKEIMLKVAKQTILLELSPEKLYEAMLDDREYTKEVINILSNIA